MTETPQVFLTGITAAHTPLAAGDETTRLRSTRRSQGNCTMELRSPSAVTGSFGTFLRQPEPVASNILADQNAVVQITAA